MRSEKSVLFVRELFPKWWFFENDHSRRQRTLLPFPSRWALLLMYLFRCFRLYCLEWCVDDGSYCCDLLCLFYSFDLPFLSWLWLLFWAVLSLDRLGSWLPCLLSFTLSEWASKFKQKLPSLERFHRLSSSTNNHIKQRQMAVSPSLLQHIYKLFVCLWNLSSISRSLFSLTRKCDQQERYFSIPPSQ